MIWVWIISCHLHPSEKEIANLKVPSCSGGISHGSRGGVSHGCLTEARLSFSNILSGKLNPNGWRRNSEFVGREQGHQKQCEAVMKIKKSPRTFKGLVNVFETYAWYANATVRSFYDPFSAETPLSQPLAMAKIRFEIPQKAAGCGGSDRPTAHWQYLEDFPWYLFG